MSTLENTTLYTVQNWLASCMKRVVQGGEGLVDQLSNVSDEGPRPQENSSCLRVYTAPCINCKGSV